MQKSYGSIYNTEDGCGPRSRRYVEVTRQEAENERKNKSKGLGAATCGRIRTQGVAMKKFPYETKE